MTLARHASPFNEQSPSPQPQPLTKRDVRRNRIMEKLQGMMNTFAMNQHHHYRAQLQAVQVDMTLVLRADPYGTESPLNDDYEGVRDLIDQVMKGDANGNGGITLPADEAARDDYWSMAGKRYREFVRQVNDAIEERDSDLTGLHNNYESSRSELDRLYQQRLHQAEEEHKALSDTIRQRLIASLTKKRQQLLRDKEQLDIADSNAMLMHPNQFSIGNNPGSPSHSAMAINKRTRHLRHHRGLSPAPSGAEGDNGKRKRKFGQTDDDQGGDSPAPIFGGGRSPFKDIRALREYAQFEAPAYSLDRIFTDKELALATDTAKIATYKYFYQAQQQLQEQALNGNRTNVPSLDGEVAESAENAGEDTVMEGTGISNGAVDTPPPAQAPEMERTASQVLTRGGARANPLAALSDLANAAAAASSTTAVIKDNPFTPVPPTYHAVTRSEKSGAPAPPPVSTLDMENDFEMMRRAGSDDHNQPEAPDVDTPMTGQDPNDPTATLDPFPPSSSAAAEAASEMRRQLLDQALGISGVQAPYRLPQLETGPGAMIGRGVDREPRTGFAPLLIAAAAAATAPLESSVRGAARAAASSLNFVGPGASMAAALSGRLGAGEPMSRTTSAGGFSEIGGDAGLVPPPLPPPPALAVTGRRGGRGRMV